MENLGTDTVDLLIMSLMVCLIEKSLLSGYIRGNTTFHKKGDMSNPTQSGSLFPSSE